jgi:HK97 gp10 family phage protein
MTEVIGLDELDKNIADIIARLGPEAIQEMSAKALEPIFEISQDLVPVKTGHLKQSGSIEKAEDGAQVVYDADYAAVVEYGSARREAQPYLRPAIDEGKEDAVNILIDEINKRLE